MLANLEHELFLKKLPDTATVASVRAFFSECTSLKSVKLNTDKATGACKGSGWIILGRKGDADWIMEEWNGAEIAPGKPIHIERSGGGATWKDTSAKEKSSGLPCKFGLTCTRPDCTFDHPDGWESHKPTVAPSVSRGASPGCRFGVGCSRPDCFFSHPEGWNPGKTTKKPCKLGRSCTFPGCFYAHRDGRECDEIEKPVFSRLKKQKEHVLEAAPDLSAGKSKHHKKSKPEKATAADIEEIVESSAADGEAMMRQAKKRKKKQMYEAKLALEPLIPVDDISTKPPRKKKKTKLAT